jgi:hypothetical protein
MQTVTHSDLPSMAATLCMYESCFGPYHPQTLNLTTTVAIAYRENGEPDLAARLLERVLRDSQRIVSRDVHLRLRTIVALRDLWVQEQDWVKAAAAQKEVLVCQTEVLGREHPDTLAASGYLAELVLGI